VSDEAPPEPGEAEPGEAAPVFGKVYEMLGATADPVTQRVPGAHVLVPKTAAAAAPSPDDFIPQVEVHHEVDLEPLDSYLNHACTEGDADLQHSAASECEDDHICFGGASDSDGDDDGQGDCLEQPLVEDEANLDEMAGHDGGAPRDTPSLDRPLMSPELLRAVHELLRLRGGSGDPWPSDDEDVGQEEEGAPEELDIEQDLVKPVWKTEGPLVVLQACQLIAEYKERHRITAAALKDLLMLLDALLPTSSCMPKTPYMYKLVSRKVLVHTFGGPTFSRLHVCSDLECPHLYTDPAQRECPDCGKPRFHKLLNGPERPIQSLRYMGVDRGVRTLLMSKKVGRSIDAFDLQEALDCPHSMYSSGFSEHLCRHFIPAYATLEPAAQRTAKHRFFSSGQVCSDAAWRRYTQEVSEGKRRRTKLIVVEGGCDGFQPYRRRVWSTWMWGYRLTGVDWHLGNLAQMEIITGISEGATEGKAAHIVASLDAHRLKELAPPSAHERELGGSGVRSACL
jgi:hypothetical protein